MIDQGNPIMNNISMSPSKRQTKGLASGKYDLDFDFIQEDSDESNQGMPAKIEEKINTNLDVNAQKKMVANQNLNTTSNNFVSMVDTAIHLNQLPTQGVSLPTAQEQVSFYDKVKANQQLNLDNQRNNQFGGFQMYSEIEKGYGIVNQQIYQQQKMYPNQHQPLQNYMDEENTQLLLIQREMNVERASLHLQPIEIQDRINLLRNQKCEIDAEIRGLHRALILKTHPAYLQQPNHIGLKGYQQGYPYQNPYQNPDLNFQQRGPTTQNTSVPNNEKPVYAKDFNQQNQHYPSESEQHIHMKSYNMQQFSNNLGF